MTEAARCIALTALVVAACGGVPRPVADEPVLSVAVALDGADPEGLEHSVVDPLERELARVRGLRSMRAAIDPGHATIGLTIDPARAIDEAFDDAIHAVAATRSHLPRELETPVVFRTAVAEPIAWLAVSGPMSAGELAEVAREAIVPRLERIAGVAQLEQRGFPRRVIAIQLDLARLAAFDVTVSELAAVVGGTAEFPAGGIMADARSVRARSSAGLADLAAIERVVVRMFDGVPVRVMDVATIENTFEGASGAGPLLGVWIQHGADRKAVLAAVHAAIAELAPTLPRPVTITEVAAPGPARPPPALAVLLRGPDLAALRAAATSLEPELRAMPGVTEVARDPPAGRPERTIVPDRDRLTRLGVSPGELAATLRAVAGGLPAGELVEGSRRTPIAIRAGGTLADAFAQLRVRGGHAERVPLASIATLGTRSTEAIAHVDRLRAITLAIHLGPGQSPQAIRGRITELTARLPSGVRAVVSP